MLALILVLGLVTYRITRFVIKDTLISAQRIWVMNRLLGRKPNLVREKLHDLLGCPHCVSAWIAAGAVAGADLFTHWDVPAPVFVWLASWAFHELVWRVVEMPIDIHLSVSNVVRHREAKYDQKAEQ